MLTLDIELYRVHEISGLEKSYLGNILALVIPPKFFVPVGEKIRKNGGTLYPNMFGLKSGSIRTCLNDE